MTRVRFEGYLSHGIQWCVTPGTPLFSSWKSSPAVGDSRKYPVQVCPEREAPAGGTGQR